MWLERHQVKAARLKACRNAKLALLTASLFAGCSPARGCAESDFDLAPESRLPKWFRLSTEQNRADVTVLMTYYIALAGPRTAAFVLRDNAGRKVATVEGSMDGLVPRTLTPAPPSGPIPYPSYEVVTINGITEIIEHRQRGPLFYITDDPEVKRILGITD